MDTPALLINMPFGTLRMPSVGLSLLAAALNRAEIPARILYLTLPFAERIGVSAYSDIANGYPSSNLLFGEWLFAADLFEGDLDDPGPARAYADAFPEVTDTLGLDIDGFVARAAELRRHVAAFLDAASAEVLASGSRIVGFSSIFQQHVASLALARRIKAADPGRFILFGGGNCEGAMGAETLRRFPFVDALVSGEGDQVIVELVRRVLAGASLDGLQGVHTRASAGEAQGLPNAPRVRDMDQLPVADYGDFFAQLEASGVAGKVRPVVPFELSRGCWWGEKMVCTFCGQNGADFSFRTKSSARAFSELEGLSARWPGVPSANVDNILSKAYFKDLFPALIARQMDLNLYIPLKADLSREQVAMLGQAGVAMVLVGVESLSGSALKIMKKGISALQNVQFLKWCKEHSVHPFWNMLFGFPGETAADYAEVIHMARRLSHIPAPGHLSPIRVDRFSPNYLDPAGHGFASVTPHRSYAHVYPFPSESLANLAYFFESEAREGMGFPENVDDLVDAFLDWIEGGLDELFHLDDGARTFVWDTRRGLRHGLTVLDGLERRVYLAMDQVQTPTRLAERLGGVGAEEIQGPLDALVARDLALVEHRRYLALGVEVGAYRPPVEHWERFIEAAEEAGWDAAGIRRLSGPGPRPTRHEVWLNT